ncbi:RNB-domain-containing protein [Ramicandelaber brevisporus]|nr:RNB-domain-containing protein [Ramicandelaber brevisporus]
MTILNVHTPLRVDATRHVKTRPLQVIKRVHEQYLRDDIPCLSSLCPRKPNQCHSATPALAAQYAHSSMLSSVVSSEAMAAHDSADDYGDDDSDSANEVTFVMPDVSAVFKYSELFTEQSTVFRNVIYTQTVMDRLLQHDYTRTLRSLQTCISDARRHCVIYHNEFSIHTAVPGRLPNESLAERDLRAILQTACWYSKHHRPADISVVVISDAPQLIIDRVLARLVETKSELAAEMQGEYFMERVRVLSMARYICEYHEGNGVLQTHLSSICDSAGSADAVDDTVTDDVRFISTGPYAVSRSSGPGSKQTNALGYTEYRSMAELETGVKSGILVKGVLKVRGNRSDEAYLDRSSAASNGNTGDLDEFADSGTAQAAAARASDIVIIGIENRNRAIGGDTVAVEIISSVDGSSDGGRRFGRVVGVFERAWRPYVATIQIDDKLRESTGSGSASASMHLAVPLDRSIPKIRIRHRNISAILNDRIVVMIDSWPADSQYPQGHYLRSLGQIGKLDTEIDAILVEYGIAVSQSAAGFSAASLKELPQLDSASPNGTTWRIDEAKDTAERRDLRASHTIFSIDPIGSEDIDDALSVRIIKDGVTGKERLELGVHIADVAAFVHEGGVTDLEARSRGTTVYLADRRFNMLPVVLSENLCSLRGGQDRFAVSVMWTFGDIHQLDVDSADVWFGRTIIRSACEMAYEQAQLLLDDKDEVVINPPESSGVPKLDRSLAVKLKPYIKMLSNVMDVLRAKRTQRGALELSSSEVRFKFKANTVSSAESNSGSGSGSGSGSEKIVDSVAPKQPLKVHKVIEEAMVLANCAVARFLNQNLPECALLRRHPPPPSSVPSTEESGGGSGSSGGGRFAALKLVAALKGFDVDVSSNRALAETIRRAVAAVGPDDLGSQALIKGMTTRAISEATYVSSGAASDLAEDGSGLGKFGHYGLALDIYTHFTSPIRRYADLAVHRQLLTILSSKNDQKQQQQLQQQQQQSRIDSDTGDNERRFVAQLCSHLNTKTRSSKFAQMDSADLFQTMYVMQRTTPSSSTPAVRPRLVEDGLVEDVWSQGLVVHIPKFGITGRVYLFDKDSQTTPAVALSALTGNPDDDEAMVTDTPNSTGYVVSVKFDESKMCTELQFGGSGAGKGPSAVHKFTLLTPVRVSLTVRRSREHRPSIQMSLVGPPARVIQPASVTKRGAVNAPPKTLITAVSANQSSQQQQQRPAPVVKTDAVDKHEAMSRMFEKLRAMSIVETTSAAS